LRLLPDLMIRLSRVRRQGKPIGGDWIYVTLMNVERRRFVAAVGVYPNLDWIIAGLGHPAGKSQ